MPRSRRGWGQLDPDAQRLIDVTEASLTAGIAAMRPGGRLSDIGAAVQGVAEAAGFSVVKEYTGHGIGLAMHEEPDVPNWGRPGRGRKLGPGQTYAVEPMVCVGSGRTRLLDDQWTVVTADGSLAAHAEHTIAITERGPEILTMP
jgi:methionyl aminopeptidase